MIVIAILHIRIISIARNEERNIGKDISGLELHKIFPGLNQTPQDQFRDKDPLSKRPVEKEGNE